MKNHKKQMLFGEEHEYILRKTGRNQGELPEEGWMPKDVKVIVSNHVLPLEPASVIKAFFSFSGDVCLGFFIFFFLTFVRREHWDV